MARAAFTSFMTMSIFYLLLVLIISFEWHQLQRLPTDIQLSFNSNEAGRGSHTGHASLASPASLTAFAVRFVSAQYPEPPYLDDCTGRSSRRCDVFNHCFYDTDSLTCYDKEYFEVRPPAECRSNSNLATKFFTQNPGQHLGEGDNFIKMIYNLDLDECALECLRSAGRTNEGNIRCLSFDFYPFADPKSFDPFLETCTRGMCVLNSANRESGRLRNEDSGQTDAELFYKSHPVHRPFLPSSGYYELRNPRAGDIEAMFDSGQDDVSISSVWGATRWGFFHVERPTVTLPSQDECDSGTFTSEGENEEMPDGVEGARFYGGYTPVSLETMHCPGRMTKAEAAKLCSETGGFLCENQQRVRELDVGGTGCGLDGESIWAASDSESSGELKFARCCAVHFTPFRCEHYEESNLDFCSSLPTQATCLKQGTGFKAQESGGFGNYLDKIRQLCQDNVDQGRISAGACPGMIVEQWNRKDECTWCLERGDAPQGGAGSCRTGAFGVCPRSSDRMKRILAFELGFSCGRGTLCRLAERYPHLKPFFLRDVQ